MTPQSVTYSAAGGCTTFGFDFPVFEPADLEVLLNGTVQTSGFILLGASSPEGGAVRFASAPAAGSAITLRRTGKVQVSGSDAPGFLEGKVVAGSHITVTKTTDAAGEHLTIATDIDPAAFATAAQGAKADSALQSSDIGTTVQAYSSKLDWVSANLSDAGKALIDDTDAAAQRATLGLGSAATKDVSTDGTLTTNSDTLLPSEKAVKTYVDGQVSEVVSSVTSALALDANLIQSYLLAAMAGSWSTGSAMNGAYDAFNSDTIGANSSGHSYTSGKYYTNISAVTRSSASGEWNGSYFTFSGSNIASAVPDGGGAIRTNDLFPGDMSLQFNSYCGADYPENDIFFYPTASDASFNSTNGARAGLGSLAGMFAVRFTSTSAWSAVYAGSSQGSGSYSQGDVFKLAREGSSVKIYRNGVVVFTFSQSSSGTVRFAASTPHYAGTAIDIRSVSWSFPTTGNMSLMSNAVFPALASPPTAVKVLALWNDVSGSASLNVDFTVEASRDGSTWTTGSLSDTGYTANGYKMLWAAINVSGQPSGTTVKVRLKTLNNKAQQVKGLALLTK